MAKQQLIFNASASSLEGSYVSDPISPFSDTAIELIFSTNTRGRVWLQQSIDEVLWDTFHWDWYTNTMNKVLTGVVPDLKIRVLTDNPCTGEFIQIEDTLGQIKDILTDVSSAVDETYIIVQGMGDQITNMNTNVEGMSAKIDTMDVDLTEVKTNVAQILANTGDVNTILQTLINP